MGVCWKWRMGVAGVAFWTAAAAGAGTLSEDAAAFGARPAVEQVAISPSGDRILMLIPGQGAQTSLKVFHLLTGEERTILSSPGTPESLRW